MAEITLSQDEIQELRDLIVEMDEQLTRLQAQPLVYAPVVKSENNFNIQAFEIGDRLLVIDRDLKRRTRKVYGKMVSRVDEDGWVIIEYPPFNGQRERVNIGLNGNVPQVKLIGKNDGTNVVIAHEGKLFEVHGLPGRKIDPTAIVKVDMESKQIHDLADFTSAGDIASVKSVIDEQHVEVECSGNNRVVLFIKKENEEPIEAGQRVMLDSTNTIIVRRIKSDSADSYNLTEQSTITWNDIAGLGEVKEALVEALETPYLKPEVYKFYNKKPPKGVLLYGPPGCGKTLCARSAANAMARIHGSENYSSGFIYVKGPELLSKWVGQAESSVRDLFARGREHYKRRGYPALLFIDEADAILPMRGSGKSSDVENTIVPMFLSEMDGLEDAHLMVMLATNQPKRIDPAILREGRIDQHIKVQRPTSKNAHEYFSIYMKDIPLEKGFNAEELATLTVKDVFSPKRGLCEIIHRKENYLFTFGDTVSGAMIKGLVDQATSYAMKRDLSNNTRTGVTRQDFQSAVELFYQRQADKNQQFDLEDFCDTHQIDRNEARFGKFVAK